ncbi:MAG: hypothetical protein MSS82_00410, partial [Bacteroidales bacterium]|nr:hypothetical protein [Bacteroidales bacterium]
MQLGLATAVESAPQMVLLHYDLKDAEIVKQIDRAMAKAQIQKDIEKRVGRYRNKDGNYYPVKSIKGNKG